MGLDFLRNINAKIKLHLLNQKRKFLNLYLLLLQSKLQQVQPKQIHLLPWEALCHQLQQKRQILLLKWR